MVGHGLDSYVAWSFGLEGFGIDEKRCEAYLLYLAPLRWHLLSFKIICFVFLSGSAIFL